MSPRRSAAEAHDTRESIIARSIEIGSVEGLEGITIGRLAGDVRMSKAGVLGHFGTKEELQRATLEAAIAIFRQQVWEPALEFAPGRQRLGAICERWISYLADPPFPGGCFLTAASCEFDGRTGPVHDAIKGALRLWLTTLQEQAQTAIDAGELPAESDPFAIAFQLNAIAMGANQAVQLLAHEHAVAIARAAMQQTLSVAEPGARVDAHGSHRPQRRPGSSP